MRVTSGSYRSRLLSSLRGAASRPTLDKVKQAVFNHLAEMQDRVFLDLFAGSGAIGIEALSRGAAKTVFNDKLPEAIEVIKVNLTKLKVPESVFAIYNLDYAVLLTQLNEKFDYIYLDPPFGSTDLDDCLKLIASRHLLQSKGTIIVESAIMTNISTENWEIYKQAKYGSIKISYLQNPTK